MRSVSVCMVTYQGAEYVAEQIESILPQLCGGDELVVSEDGSTDGTREIVAQYARGGAPLRLIDGPRQGLVANFQNVVSNASGEVLFLADQDDVWLPGKVERMLAEFDDPACLVAVHDAALVDAEGKPLGQTAFALRHNLSFREQFERNRQVGIFLAQHGKEFAGISEVSSGAALVKSVAVQRVREKNIAEVARFGVDCVARFAGNRQGRKDGIALAAK